MDINLPSERGAGTVAYKEKYCTAHSGTEKDVAPRAHVLHAFLISYETLECLPFYKADT